MSIPSRIGPPQTMRETTSRSVTTSNVSVLLKDFAVSPKIIHFNLASSPRHEPAPTNKEPCHETRHSLCKHSCRLRLCERRGAGVGAHGAVSLSGHCADPREVEVHYVN